MPKSSNANKYTPATGVQNNPTLNRIKDLMTRREILKIEAQTPEKPGDVRRLSREIGNINKELQQLEAELRKSQSNA